MSALWQTQPSHLSSIHGLSQSLELRQFPHINYDISSYKNLVEGPVLEQLFKDLKTNWMYSATIQLTLNGSEPAWSKDGWSFVPLDFASLSVSNGSNQTTDVSNDVGSGLNATLETPAIRARLDCKPWPNEKDPWWLVQTNDVTNTSIWDEVTNPSQYPTGYYFNDSFPLLPGSGIALCCAQGTMQDPGTSELGYWVLDHEEAGWADRNFSAKWFTGTAQIFQPRMIDTYSNPRFTWLEKPTVVAVECTPIIESANAQVMLDVASQSIYNYTILDNATPEENAWTDSFVQHGTEEYVRNITTRLVNVS